MTWAGATRRVVEAEGEGAVSGSIVGPEVKFPFITTNFRSSSSRNMGSSCNPCRLTSVGNHWRSY